MMTHCINTGQPLFRPHLSSFNWLMNKVATVARWRLWMGSATRISTHWGWPGSVCCWVPHLPVAKTTLNSWHGNTPWANQWQSDYVGLLPSWKAQHFVLTRPDTDAGYGLALPACNVSVKTTIVYIQNASSIVLVFPVHGFCLRNSLHSKCSAAMAILMEFTVLLYSAPFWSNWLHRMVDWLFAYMYSESVCNICIYGTVAPIQPGFVGPEIKGWK